MRHTFLNAGFGNLIKGNAVFILYIQFQNISQMPGNCFSLAVRVGCQIDFIRLFSGGLQALNGIRLFTNIQIFRGKIMFYIDTEGTFGKIPYMSHRSHDLIIFPQIFFNGFRLCRRFYNNKLTHRGYLSFHPFPISQKKRRILSPIERYALQSGAQQKPLRGKMDRQAVSARYDPLSPTEKF